LTLALLAAAAARLRTSMPAGDVLRRLSGMRVALTFYRLEHKHFPSSFEETISSGKLEAVSDIKLSGHFSSAKVRNVPAFVIKDTGGWAYVNNPADPQFGLLYIDSSRKDEKGRYWSEF